MSMIRKAVPEDLDTLIQMGERFFAYSRFANVVAFDRETVRASLDALIGSDTSLVLVAVVDGQIIGGIAGTLAPLWFAPGMLSATEFAWWIDEAHRGGVSAVRLLRAFEQWAKTRGAAVVSMSDLVIDGQTPAGSLFDRLGYVVVERSHVKRIGG